MTPEGHYPKNPLITQYAQTYKSAAAVAPLVALVGTVVRLTWTAAQAVLGVVTALHAAVADNGTTQTITTGFNAMSCPRNVTVTSTGTAGDQKAISVTVTGTDIEGNAITEVLPVFTVDTLGTKTGAKIFASITSMIIPANDGTGVSFSLGEGNLLGLPYKLLYNSTLFGVRGTTREATAPTILNDATNLYGNNVSFNTALNGTVCELFLVPVAAAAS